MGQARSSEHALSPNLAHYLNWNYFSIHTIIILVFYFHFLFFLSSFLFFVWIWFKLTSATATPENDSQWFSILASKSILFSVQSFPSRSFPLDGFDNLYPKAYDDSRHFTFPASHSSIHLTSHIQPLSNSHQPPLLLGRHRISGFGRGRRGSRRWQRRGVGRSRRRKRHHGFVRRWIAWESSAVGKFNAV